MTRKLLLTTTRDRENMQSDQNPSICWANAWQMEFSVEKYKMLYIGIHNDDIQ